MTATEALARGRAAFAQEAWSQAYTRLAAADRLAPLEPDDLDRLATAAYLIGEDTASADARTRAHNGFLERGETIRAARSAFWLAFSIIDNPAQRAQAGGWLARARRLLDESTLECVEQGFLLCAFAFQKTVEGEVEAAYAAFGQAAQIGARFKDPDLTALARHGEGRTLLRMEKRADGFAMLDEVMVAVTCGEVAPMVAGLVYCSVIGACHDLFDPVARRNGRRRSRAGVQRTRTWCPSAGNVLFADPS
jgi:hypothetical protein